MSGHLPIVALELRIAAWLLGAPSFLSTLGLTVGAFFLRQRPDADISHNLDVKTYGLVGLLENGARGVARILEFLLGAAAWVVTALAFACLAFTLIAATLYLIARGIQQHATWARIVGVVIFLGFLPVAFGALSVLPRLLVPVDWALIGAALYSLWALVWRFNEA